MTNALSPSFLFAQSLVLFTKDSNFLTKGQENKVFLSYGIPAWGVFYDLKPPKKAFCVLPDKKFQNLSLFRTLLKDPALNIDRIAFFTYVKSDNPGIYTLCIEGKRTLTPQNFVVKEFAKVYLFLPGPNVWQVNWKINCGFPLEILPLSRPYGIEKGDLLWGKVLLYNQSLTRGNIKVVYELLKKQKTNFYISKRQSLNKSPLFYFKETYLNSDGTFVITFPQPGWWLVSLMIPWGNTTYANSVYPFYLKTDLWVYVFP